MLVLSRKCNERIRIADNITITIVRIQGRTVRIGIEAPANVSIVRAELLAKPQSQAVAGERPRADISAPSPGASPASTAHDDDEPPHAMPGFERRCPVPDACCV